MWHVNEKFLKPYLENYAIQKIFNIIFEFRSPKYIGKIIMSLNSQDICYERYSKILIKLKYRLLGDKKIKINVGIKLSLVLL